MIKIASVFIIRSSWKACRCITAKRIHLDTQISHLCQGTGTLVLQTLLDRQIYKVAIGYVVRSSL